MNPTNDNARIDFLKEIEKIVELPTGTIHGAEPLNSLNWDSMAVVMLIALADEKYGKVINANDVKKANCVDDLFQLMRD